MLAFVLFGLFSITMCVNSVEKCFNTTDFVLCWVIAVVVSSDILLCSSCHIVRLCYKYVQKCKLVVMFFLFSKFDVFSGVVDRL